LARVLEHPAKTPADCCRRWTALIEWGQQQLARRAPGSPIDLQDEVHAHSLYGTPESTLSSPLLWATEAKAATVALHPLAVDAGFVAGDLIPLHALDRDLDRILDGEAVDIRSAAEQVRLIVAEIEIQNSLDVAPDAVGAATPMWPPPEHATLRWDDLAPIEQQYVTVLVQAGPGVQLDVHELARRSRATAPNRHDWDAAKKLVDVGLLEKGGRGRRLVALPRGYIPPKRSTSS
jgi:hypothetical protein